MNHIPFYFENKSQTNCTRNTVQYSTVQYGTVRYGTVRYSTVQYSTVQYSTVQYSTVQYSTGLYFCEAVPNAAVFIVVFQVYANYLILKFN